jgi:LmbE family N-acetylglucosaminyl deacetylase
MRAMGIAAVLTLGFWTSLGSQSVPQDTGASGAWQKLLKLRTTASVLHATAHPDDEHAGVLAVLGRRDGARVALMTLTRGESGDNAIGPQLFDGLALIRTDELLTADKYYGVDEQYFTTVVDYGFSKRLDEALDKWGTEAAMRDVVRVIRMTRPWVLLSRFQGNERDGHGNHSAAGLLSQQAAKMAGDPEAFPEQIAEGLRPWTPFKVYMGGVRANEAWTVRVDSGEYSPWLGDSYDNTARFGLSFQRSQNSGRFTPGAGPTLNYYTRTASRVAGTDKEDSIWDGLDTTYAGLFRMLGRPAPAGVVVPLAAIDGAVGRALSTFSITDPSAVVPALAEGLRLTRDVMSRIAGESEALFLLGIKARQFQDAISAALGLDLTAMAEPAGAGGGGGRGGGPFAAAATMAAPVPGQTFAVQVRLANRGGVPIQLAPGRDAFQIRAERGWTASHEATPPAAPAGTAGQTTSLGRHEVATARFSIDVASDAPISTKPYFSRASLHESRYELSDPASFGRPFNPPPLVAAARYTVNGERVELSAVVQRRESKAPYGDAIREVRTVPRVALTVSPAAAVVPLAARSGSVDLQVSVVHNADAPTKGQVTLTLPPGWTSVPEAQPFAFRRPGERASYQFKIHPVAIDAKAYEVVAVATADGRSYREGYELIEPRDLEARYLYRPSTASVRGIDVEVAPNLKVGYVMGIGDQVPVGLQQLGAEVTLLTERDLATADLSVYDTIMTGTRAYAVREDLRTYNRRLLDYVNAGGNMVVLYNTFEFVPNEFAPFPGTLLRTAEEVSEENSPVTILAPKDRSFAWPNSITAADFDGWVEQRGSKFFTTWDPAYTPLISTFDKGQAPQQGGWLTARHGKGTWTYFAYALHRQLPYGVPGAFRITANLLALGKTPR